MCLACEGNTLDDIMQKIANNIHANTVTYAPVSDGRHGFVYTVGMHGIGMPELYADAKSGFVVPSFGDLATNLADVLKRIVATLRKDGITPTINTRLPDNPIDGTPAGEIRFEHCTTERLVLARGFYAINENPVRALRVVRKTPRAART